MEEWREIAQSVIIGLIFSYLVAKLISIVVHFKDEQLHLTRSSIETQIVPEKKVVEEEEEDEEEEGETSKVANFGAPNPKTTSSSSSEDEDDWEGVESTELDEAFSAATAFVAATAVEGRAKVGTDVQLHLYGLYKIATEGPCTTPQPSPLKMAARAKWNAWQKLGAMPPEEAMEKYIVIVTELYPSWAAASSSARNQEGTDKASSSAKGTIGPVFSSFIDAEEAATDLKLDAAHISAREGCADDLIKLIDGGIPVDLKDGEGRTPLHWAVDRGHYYIVELLITRKADVNAKDNEGQTPLHYAALCERKEIAELLVKHGAAVEAKDDDGNHPSDLCDSSWDFMTPTS